MASEQPVKPNRVERMYFLVVVGLDVEPSRPDLDFEALEQQGIEGVAVFRRATLDDYIDAAPYGSSNGPLVIKPSKIDPAL